MHVGASDGGVTSERETASAGKSQSVVAATAMRCQALASAAGKRRSATVGENAVNCSAVLPLAAVTLPQRNRRPWRNVGGQPAAAGVVVDGDGVPGFQQAQSELVHERTRLDRGQVLVRHPGARVVQAEAEEVPILAALVDEGPAAPLSREALPPPPSGAPPTSRTATLR